MCVLAEASLNKNEAGDSSLNITENSKVVHARLTEPEMAALNLLMQRHGCKNLPDLLKLVVGGKSKSSRRSNSRFRIGDFGDYLHKIK